MIKRYNYRIYPNKEQDAFFQKTFGSCRFVYNWALAKKIDDYQRQKSEGIEKPKSLSIYDISKELTLLKKEAEYAWLNDVPSGSLIFALQNLDTAYKNFFRRVKKGETPGFPKFKAKHKSKKAFSYQNVSGEKMLYHIDQNLGYISVPKVGKVKAVFHRIFEGRYTTTTISQEPSGKYYASIVVDDHKPAKEMQPLTDRLLGVDHGVKKALTLSNGHTLHVDLDFSKEEKRLLRVQKDLSRKEKGSFNFQKNKILVAKAHEKIRIKRKMAIEKLSCELVLYLLENKYSGIVIRKYDVKGMTKRPKKVKTETGYAHNGAELKARFNKMILNSSLGFVFEHLKSKLTENGIHVFDVPADLEKTTMKCSKCDSEVVSIDWRLRELECKNCGHCEDMDLNAAKNTLKMFTQHAENQSVAV